MSSVDDLGKRLVEFGFERWHSRTGLAIVMTGVAVTGIAIFAGINLANVSLPEWAIVAAAGLVVWLAWLKTSIPRAPRGRIGFGVAIEFENSEQAKQLRADFVVTLRDLLNGSKLRHRFAFIDYPQSIAKRITDDQQAG